MSGVEVEGVTFGYAGGPPVLRDVDLRVADGSVTAVVGPSGCGKTTLLRLVAGFERPTSGSITIGGAPVAGRTFVAPHLRRVGVVPQEGALFPHLTLARNVGLGLPRRSADRGPRVAELLALGGLEGLDDRLPRELSGGQQQRAALLRALAPRPRLVLLDEPFGSLDAEVRVRIRSSVRELLARERATALLVTHDREEALGLADTVAVMVDGAVAQSGPPETVYARPVSRAVAGLLGEAGYVPVTPRPDGRLDGALGPLCAVEAPVDVPSVALLRPEQVVPAGDGEGVPAQVLDADYTGAGVRARVRLPDGLVVPALLPTGARVGDAVRLRVTGPVHLLPA